MLNKLTDKHIEVRDYLRMIFQDEGPDSATETTQDISDVTGYSVSELWDKDQETGILADLLQHGMVEKWEGKTSADYEWIAAGCEIEFLWN